MSVCTPAMSIGTRNATTGREPSAGTFANFFIGDAPGRSSVTGTSVPGAGPSILTVTSTSATSPLVTRSGALIAAIAASFGRSVEPISTGYTGTPRAASLSAKADDSSPAFRRPSVNKTTPMMGRSESFKPRSKTGVQSVARASGSSGFDGPFIRSASAAGVASPDDSRVKPMASMSCAEVIAASQSPDKNLRATSRREVFARSPSAVHMLSERSTPTTTRPRIVSR